MSSGRKILPVREQVRTAWSGFRWLFWPRYQETWANIASLLVLAAGAVAVAAQIWLGLLAGFFLWFAVGFAGRKR